METPETPSTHQLEISRLLLNVRLGCSEQERQIPQAVEASVIIQFRDEPIAARTDRLSDTICYARICESIKELVRDRSFNMVEFLARTILDTISRQVTVHATIEVKVHKLTPPIPNLLGGVIYSCKTSV